ncbi:MAG: hypothetical protein QXI16_05815 [Sulfolobaceae archaeon]
MKAILKSIRPQHTKNIKVGKKKLELDKRLPKAFTGWVFIYETLGQQKYVSDEFWGDKYPLWYGHEIFKNGKRLITQGCGQIIGKFWFDEYEAFNPHVGNPRIYVNACVDDREPSYYAGKRKILYAWHIKKLEIFDKPMHLSDFVSDKLVVNVCGNDFKCYSETASYFARKDQRLTKAPQSYQFVWVKE